MTIVFKRLNQDLTDEEWTIMELNNGVICSIVKPRKQKQGVK